MKVSLNWLRDYLDLPASLDAQEIARRLTFAGTEVESVTDRGRTLRGVHVALVKQVEKHPNADRLSLCQVDTGKETLSIVCGASNVRAGLKVALAPIGVKLPNGLEIARSKIRGVVSEGMLCSVSELGLAKESQGILELPEASVVGEELVKALGLEDVILELAVTPNRPDLLGHLGVARELAALFSLPLRAPTVSIESDRDAGGLSVEITDGQACPAYLGRVMENVAIVPSPPAIQRRLEAIGLRPINQVVDATNYVLMELGHPTHAFDKRQIDSGKITVRKAKAGEKLTLLDGRELALNPQDLLIADPKKPLALAGVMGGKDSGVADTTKDLILECAYFDPSGIRRSARSYGIVSDSSYRFERGTNPEQVALVIDRLAQLISEWTVAAGKPKPRVHAVVRKDGAALPKPKQIDLPQPFVEARLGTAISASQVKTYLESIGLTAKGAGWVIPGFRLDLHRPIDLVDEIARLHGYDKILPKMPKPMLRPLRAEPQLVAKRRAAEALRHGGFSEAIHYSFVARKDLEDFGVAKDHPLAAGVALRNPISEEQAILRTVLTPGLLRALAYNANREVSDLRLFECGKVFRPQQVGVGEQIHLAGAALGRRFGETWSNPVVEFDFFDLKGAFEGLCEAFDWVKVEFVQPSSEDLSTRPFLHPGQSLMVIWQGEKIGFLGALHPLILANFGLEREVFAFEVAFEPFWRSAPVPQPFRSIPQYPSVRRDMALLVAEEIPAKRVYDLIFSMKNGIIERLDLFDVYRGKQVPEGKKSLAFALHYLSRERTLTSEEVDRTHQQILKRLAEEFGASIRT